MLIFTQKHYLNSILFISINYIIMSTTVFHKLYYRLSAALSAAQFTLTDYTK